MKLTILPNWCKWISFALLIPAFLFISGVFLAGVMDGYNEQVLLHNPDADVALSGMPPLDGALPTIGSWLAIIAIIMFILSKEKRDDDYLNAIRGQALLIALLFSSIVLFITLFLQMLLLGIHLLIIYFLSYIVIFKIMKMKESFSKA